MRLCLNKFAINIYLLENILQMALKERLYLKIAEITVGQFWIIKNSYYVCIRNGQ